MNAINQKANKKSNKMIKSNRMNKIIAVKAIHHTRH
jgi:hypothetical protein